MIVKASSHGRVTEGIEDIIPASRGREKRATRNMQAAMLQYVAQQNDRQPPPR